MEYGPKSLSIQYRLTYPGGEELFFDLQVESETLILLAPLPERAPEWTRLAFHQCPSCPPSAAANTHCPAALGLAGIVRHCQNTPSYSEVLLEVTTAERKVSGQTTTHRAIGSLMGLLMATSGCPRLAFFRPMARFHLPLASEEETIYRATSMYLLAQYFLVRQGQPLDLELKGLEGIYRNIQEVNRAIAERLRAASREDSAVNAVIQLDLFAKAMPYALKTALEELRYLFTAYLDE